MRPFTSGRGIVLTSLSGPGSPARDIRTSAESRRSHSCFMMTFTASPNAFMVLGNFPCATGRVCGLSVTSVSGKTTPHPEQEHHSGRAGRGSFGSGLGGGSWTVNRAGKIVDFLALKRNTALLLGALVLAL